MQRILIAFLLLMSFNVVHSQVTTAKSEEEALGERLATLLNTVRSVVSEHQDLINDPSIGDKGIDGDSVVAETIAIYTERAGAPPITPETSERERLLNNALIESIREVVDENETQIDSPGLGFKGFIPAVFARLVGERFAKKVGTEARLKVTAPVEIVRNRKATPDEWEHNVIVTHFSRPEWEKGKAYTEKVEIDGRTAFRMLIPEYYSESCLICHGEPAGEMDVTGYPKEGRSEGDLAGAISIALFE